MIESHFFDRANLYGFSLPNSARNKQYFKNTNCIILDGKQVAEEVLEQCKKIATNKQTHLAVILIGDNPASKIYVKNKIKKFQQANCLSTLFAFSKEEATEEKILNCIKNLNKDSLIHGILVQLPLPAHLNKTTILNAIDDHKDVDGFSAKNIGSLALNKNIGFYACTPFGVMILLSAYNIDPSGKHCVVIGRSTTVGKPMGLLLLNSNATVTFVHSYTKDIHTHTQNADILIVATGQKHFIRKDNIKDGAVIIDVGIHKNGDGTLSGDVHPEVRFKASALTPVPGGVGPMTIAALLLNTTLASLTQPVYPT